MITRRTPIMGNGREEKPLFADLEAPAIAHDERVARARFVTFSVPERDFPRNRSPLRWKFVCRPKRKVCAPSGVAKQQRSSPPSSCLPRLRGKAVAYVIPRRPESRGV